MLGGKLTVGCKGAPSSSWGWPSTKHCRLSCDAHQRTHTKQVNKGSVHCSASAKDGELLWVCYVNRKKTDRE